MYLHVWYKCFFSFASNRPSCSTDYQMLEKHIDITSSYSCNVTIHCKYSILLHVVHLNHLSVQRRFAKRLTILSASCLVRTAYSDHGALHIV